MRRKKAPRWFRWLARLPGLTADLFERGGVDEVHDQVADEDLAALARRSPRGHAYLSLESGLKIVREGDALITYRSHGRTAFVVGGYHGPQKSAPDRLVRMRSRLTRAGYRRVLLFPGSQYDVPLLSAGGFGTVQVGAEAFVDPRRFSLSGKRLSGVRYMARVASRRGNLTVREMDPEQEGTALEGVYARWREGLLAGRAMRLLVGTPCLKRPLGRRYFGALSESAAELAAFVTLTPGWNGRGWGVDVMARTPTAPAGAMDLLLVRIIESLGKEGAECLSLGPSPMLEPPGHRPPGRWLPRFFRYLYRSRLGNRLFPFQGLAFFKNKFAPRWEPVFLAAWPKAGVWSLYEGCRMWGLFD